jgi:hypothetical protein
MTVQIRLEAMRGRSFALAFEKDLSLLGIINT